MSHSIRIRENQNKYMADIKAWLNETEHTPLEEMGAFFSARLSSYEEHMSTWSAAYRRMAELVPAGARTLLDIGCGTGLELDEILRLRPDIEATGVDLSPDMLYALRRKHPSVKLICGDYLTCWLPLGSFDVAVSFETLHHLTPESKSALFSRIYDALGEGGEYIQADYIACCEEEEALLMETLKQRKARDGMPEDSYVHFDTPLTLEHELALMRGAGFRRVEPVECINGACIIIADK